MIDLFIDNKASNMAAVWYHYKTDFNAPHTYSLSISLDESEILAFIERYAGCTIEDTELAFRIISKDEKEGSLGLIWNLLVLLKKQSKVFREEHDIIGTLNNIRQIKIENGYLIIIGDASDNRLGDDSFEQIERRY